MMEIRRLDKKMKNEKQENKKKQSFMFKQLVIPRHTMKEIFLYVLKLLNSESF